MKNFYYRPLQKGSTLPSSGSPAQQTEHPAWEIIKFAFFALLIVVPLRLFVAQPFIVSGQSMVPTFHDKEYLLVDQISYRFSEPHRGDVIVFQYPRNPSRYFIKRVIGLPGEVIEFQGDSVIIKNALHPEGFTLDEPYIYELSTSSGTTQLDDDEYFVMGDNRRESSDSRFWGPLQEDFVVGRALLRLLPPGRAALFPGNYRSLYGEE